MYCKFQISARDTLLEVEVNQSDTQSSEGTWETIEVRVGSRNLGKIKYGARGQG